MRALVAGWFSFEQMGATAGDLLAKDLVCEWLDSAGRPYDVALAPSFSGGVDWATVDPNGYSELVFVCGPFGNGPPLTDLLPRFEKSRLIGVNLSMLEPLEVWNPFALLLERDSSRAARPDISFDSHQTLAPVVGVVLVHPQSEYEGAMHGTANEFISRLVAEYDIAVVGIDTRLDENSTGLRTPAQVESTIAHMDAVVTTRLHGMVLALRNGVPALAIDPIAGGAKVSSQARTIGWPAAFTVDELDKGEVRRALEYCLTEEARAKAAECTWEAREVILQVRREFVSAIASLESGQRA